MGKLDGKVAFITGAARGQGQAHAVKLAGEGADIIAVDLCAQIATVEYPMATPEDLAHTVKLVEDTGRRIVARQADVRDRTSLEVAFAEGIAELGRVDIVIANAGIMPTTGPTRDELQAFQDAIDVMLTGVVHTVRIAMPKILEQDQGGAVVITSSTAGLKGLVGDGAHGALGYLAAKHAVVGLMRGWSNCYGPKGVRFNTVHPTGTNTPMVVNEAFANFVGEFPDIAAAFQNVMPVELVEPEDIANAVLFLVSDDGRYVTGQTLAVDAGFLAR